VRRSLKYGLYAAVLAGVVGSTVAWANVDKTVTVQVDGQTKRIHTVASDVRGTLSSAGYKIESHDLVAPAPDAKIHDGSTVVFKRGRLLHLIVDGQQRDLWVTTPTVSQALAELGLPTTALTSVSRDKRLPLTPSTIDIRAPKTVTITADGKSQTVDSTDVSVGELLADLAIGYTASDRITPTIGTPLSAGLTVTVQRVTNQQITAIEALPFPTTQQNDATLAKGSTTVVKSGKNGSQQVTYDVVYVDGVPSGQTVLAATVLSAPVAQVVKVGTKVAPAAAPTPAAPIVVDPASAQGIAKQLMLARGWGDDQLACLIPLWSHESGWRVNAANSSGAYGIPQALPGSKMAAFGADWQTNPATQIAWGLSYIAGRYSTPCGAWSSWQAHGWY
jgi:uncharacterized protein YabE (DUF348 family)